MDASRPLRLRASKLLLIPVLAAGLTVAAAPADAGTPTIQGVASSGADVPVVTPADPPAWGRPVGFETGRRPR